MLAALIIILWIFFFTLIYGLMGIRFIEKILKIQDNRSIPFTITICFGLCILTAIASYFTLFMKIGLAVNLILIIFAAFYYFFDHKFINNYFNYLLNYLKSINPWLIFYFFTAFLIIIFETAIYIPKNLDTPSYHAQAIRWIENFPVIPGLGNLNKFYAYNSHWFIASALFSFSFLKLQSFHVLNGFIMTAGALFFTSSLNRFGKSKLFAGDIISICSYPIIFFLFLNFSSSPGTDTAPALLIFIIFSRLILIDESYDNSSTALKPELIIILTLMAFIVTIKLSGAPILLLSLPVFIKFIINKKIKALFFTCLACLLIILPWVARNIIISGYLIFPFDKIDIFGFDWKIPGYILRDVINGMKIWSFPIGNIPLSEYIPAWLDFIKIQYKAFIFPLLILSVISMIFYLSRLIVKPRLIFQYLSILKKYLWYPITVYLAVAFLFVNAPDVRYGAAFFMLFFLIHITPFFAIIFSGLRREKFIIFISSAMILFTIAFEIFLYQRYFYYNLDDIVKHDPPSIVTQRIILPAGYGKDPAGTDLHVLSNNNFTLNIYTARTICLCWYDPFPCTTRGEWNLIKGIELRGNDILHGFRIPAK